MQLKTIILIIEKSCLIKIKLGYCPAQQLIRAIQMPSVMCLSYPDLASTKTGVSAFYPKADTRFPL
jgi:hypothetical protein